MTFETHSGVKLSVVEQALMAQRAYEAWAARIKDLENVQGRVCSPMVWNSLKASEREAWAAAIGCVTGALDDIASVESVTVEAFLDSVSFVRQEHGSGNVAKAYAMLADDADCHKFKVAVPREFARKLDEYLATWDEADESPKITLTLTIPEDE